MLNPSHGLGRIVYQALGEFDTRSQKIDDLVDYINTHSDNEVFDYIQKFVERNGLFTQKEINYIEHNTRITLTKR